MDKLSFAEILVESGFSAKGQYKYNPKEGWNGLTVYHPLVKLYKDDVVVMFSLERHNVMEVVYSREGKKVNTVTEKLIKITKSDNLIYESLFGVVPNDDILNLILK